MHEDTLFRLHRPTTIEEAVSLAADLENRNQGFDWVSGGTDLLANYKWHINTKPHVISLASIEELTRHDRYHIGAMVRLHDLEHGPTRTTEKGSRDHCKHLDSALSNCGRKSMSRYTLLLVQSN